VGKGKRAAEHGAGEAHRREKAEEGVGFGHGGAVMKFWADVETGGFESICNDAYSNISFSSQNKKIKKMQKKEFQLFKTRAKMLKVMIAPRQLLTKC
jgi:hypothetical protein